MTGTDFIEFNRKFADKVLGNKLETFFGPLLLGQKVVSKGETGFRHYFKVKMKLENGDEYETQYHRSELTENPKCVDISKRKSISLNEYFHLFIENREIEKICFNFGRKFDLHLVCQMKNSEGVVNIPLGLDLMRTISSGWLEKILTEEERENYKKMHRVCYQLECYNNNGIFAFEEQVEIYDKILEILKIKGEYRLSDFYKLDKMYEVFKTERIECSDLYAAIERIVYE